MNHFFKKSISVLMVFLMLFTIVPTAFAANKLEIEAATTDTEKFIYHTVKSPELGSVGGEWAVLGLARSSYDVPVNYYKDYYETVEKYVKACKGNLHDKKYTEYARLILALSAIGKDPSNVAGYNLLTALGDYDKTIWQGVNGPIWALIALDSKNYEIPKNPNAKTQATRELYVKRIISCQHSDGGWSLSGDMEKETASDPDITGMALQSLAKYQDIPEVEKACLEALNCMSKMQNSNGGFSSSWGSDTSESCVQMIVGLCEMGISLEDERFVKNNMTILDALMTFYKKGNGFLHTHDGQGSNQMASEQGLYCLVAVARANNKKNSLYRMDDSINMETTENISGFTNKTEEKNSPNIIKANKTFDDIQTHQNRLAIETLASREIINGKTEILFDPNSTMTRAEFATIIVKALGLKPNESGGFVDVKASDWFGKFVGTANQYGIVAGKSNTCFDPMGTITREEAATMISRAAKLCNMSTEFDQISARDVLSQFHDYVKCSAWAIAPLAFCYENKILDCSAMEIQPKAKMKRCEIAQMLYNMLVLAKRL